MAAPSGPLGDQLCEALHQLDGPASPSDNAHSPLPADLATQPLEAVARLLLERLTRRAPADTRDHFDLLLTVCREISDPTVQVTSLQILERCLLASLGDTRHDADHNLRAMDKALALLKVSQVLLNGDRAAMVQVLQLLAILYPHVFRAALTFPTDRQAEVWNLLQTMARENTYLLEIPDNALFLGALRFYYVIIDTLSTPDSRIPEMVNLTGSASASVTHVRPVCQNLHAFPHLDQCPADHPFLHRQALARDARHYYDQTLLILQQPHASCAALLALITLCSGHMRTRPEVVAFTVPQFVAWRKESAQKFTVFQWKCLDKAVRAHWFNVYKVLHQATAKVLNAQRPVPDKKSPFPLFMLAKQVLDRGGRQDFEAYLARFARFLQQQRHTQELTRGSRSEAARTAKEAESQPASSERKPSRWTDAIPPPPASGTQTDITQLPVAAIISSLLKALRDVSEDILRQKVQKLPTVPGTGRILVPPAPFILPTLPPTDNPPSPAGSLKRPRSSGGPDREDNVSIPEGSHNPSTDGKRARLADTIQPVTATAPEEEEAPPVDPEAEDEERASFLPAADPSELAADDNESMLRASLARLLAASSEILAPANLITYPGPRQATAPARLLPPASARLVGGEEMDLDICSPPTVEQIMTDWMVIVARLTAWVTQSRAASLEQDEVRVKEDDDGIDQQASPETEAITAAATAVAEQLVDFVTAEFRPRYELAILWLHELWYQNQTAPQPARLPEVLRYTTWFRRLLDRAVEKADARDVVLARLVLDVPELPLEALQLLQEQYRNPTKQKACIGALKELVELRPPTRTEALRILLEFTSATERPARQMAIKVVREWYPDHAKLSAPILAHAEQAFQSLARLPKPEALVDDPPADVTKLVDPTAVVETDGGTDGTDQGVAPENPATDMAVDSSAPADQGGEGTQTEEAEAKPDPLTMAQKYLEVQVVERSELFLALCSKHPDLFSQVFDVYPQLQEFTQKVVRRHVTELVKVIGPEAPGMHRALRACPAAAEDLMLSVVGTLSNTVAPVPELAVVILEICTEGRDTISPRLLVPVLHGLKTKAEALRALALVLAQLNDPELDRAALKEAIRKLVSPRPLPGTTTATTAGGGSGVKDTPNPPKLGRPLVSPTDVLVAIHNMEEDIGLKSTAEALQLCLPMGSVFTSEHVAAALQQLVEQPRLPDLFMRTVIQTAGLHKNLTNFVTMILSRLVRRKAWTMPRIWEGFLRCCKLTQPTSLPVLLQLPKEVLETTLKKHTDLRQTLQQYVSSLTHIHLSRIQHLLPVINDEAAA